MTGNFNFFETFFPKLLHVKDFCLTFASAFENELDKPNGQNETCFSFVMAKVRIKRTKPQADGIKFVLRLR